MEIVTVIPISDTPVSTVACCAGSGKSVLSGCRADVWLTGEMSHHEVLDAVHSGVSVILCEHSNSERGFLKEFAAVLENEIWKDVDPRPDVVLSKKDRDPLLVV